MSQEDDIKQYGAEDFERYYSGKMTELQMHALEKAALDDPFLSDALDGYVYTQNAVSDTNELKTRLLQNSDDKKIAWFKRSEIVPLLKIAAVLILFAGFGWLLYENNKAKKTEIASIIDNSIQKEIPSTTEYKKTDSVVPPQSGIIITTETASGTIQQQPILLNTKPVTTTKKLKANAADNTFTVNTLSTNAVSYAADTNAVAYYSGKDTSAAKDINNTLAGKIAGAQVLTKTNLPKTLIGRVIDNNGKPVSFASVIYNKNKKGISTDMNGLFAFKSNDTAPLVAVNAIGYNPLTWKLNADSAENNIVLTETVQTLKEVVVTSAFQTKRTLRSTSSNQTSVAPENTNIQRVTITNAIPVKGWQHFNNYVNDSLKTLQQLTPVSVSAEVLVTFNINHKGEPVDIHVQKSLCSICEEEAIRIIKNGPAFKLNNKRKKARAVVKF